MNNDIAGIPFLKAEFDEKGAMKGSAPALPAGTTHVYVISHGWNNSDKEASDLYTELFTNFKAVAPATLQAPRRLAIVGVYWPSKKFDEMVAVQSAASSAGGSAAGLGAAAVADPAGEDRLQTKLQNLKDFFKDPVQQQTLEEARALVPKLERDANAREAFVEKLRSLVDASHATRDDASSNFFAADALDLMERLRIEEEDLDLGESGTKGGSASLVPNQAGAGGATGGAAGILEFFGGFKNAAINIVNYTTYYEMKNRAGIVGARGVAPMLDAFPREIRNIHLIGHSFGGRVVTAAAAESKTDMIRSMSLLQAAFSHNGFSQSMKGFFRKVVDEQRIKGPILVTHTKNDEAVGVAYPIASRLAGQVAAALGDENDKFGGLGRNGAQKMNVGEVIKGTLQPVDGNYTFAPGKFFNALADQFIPNHGSVRGREVAYAVVMASLGNP
jgi:predicted alpha/beta hydrolase family esterase